MLVLYDLTTKEIKGVAMVLSDSSKKVPEPTFKGSLPKQKAYMNLGHFVAPNDERMANEIYRYSLKFDERGNPTGIVKKPLKPKIVISTDAPDFDSDGISEILADGTSKATIVASIRDDTGKIIADRSYLVHFKTTGGILLNRTVPSETGVAKTVLQSVPETLRVTITGYAEGCKEGEMELEFVSAKEMDSKRGIERMPPSEEEATPF